MYPETKRTKGTTLPKQPYLVPSGPSGRGWLIAFGEKCLIWGLAGKCLLADVCPFLFFVCVPFKGSLAVKVCVPLDFVKVCVPLDIAGF
jgi:hypothetical protein